MEGENGIQKQIAFDLAGWLESLFFLLLVSGEFNQDSKKIFYYPTGVLNYNLLTTRLHFHLYM